MLIIGVILLVIGLVLGIHLLWIAGLVIAAIGLVLLLIGGSHPVGGRRWWY
jgi:hypothetical protein